MASLKELKNRIRSVKSTQKITKAKQMVAAAKLRRAQAAAEAARPYATRFSAVMASLAGKVDPTSGPLLLRGTGSDLDASTQRLLNRGARLTELLKQPQFSPMPFEEQTVSIYAGTNGFLDAVPVTRVTEYEEQMLSFMRSEHADVLEEIRSTQKFEGEVASKTKAALETFAKQFA